MPIINLCFSTPDLSVGGQKQTEELEVLELVPHKNLDFQKCSAFPREGGSRWIKCLNVCPFIDCSILKNNY